MDVEMTAEDAQWDLECAARAAAEALAGNAPAAAQSAGEAVLNTRVIVAPQTGSHEELARQLACGRERQYQADVLRDVFGHLPFRGVRTDPAWQTSNAGCAVDLARAAYEERRLPAGTLDIARLAALADALEEAGCADEHMLLHLRSPGPHVRGCWVIDLVLSKE